MNPKPINRKKIIAIALSILICAGATVGIVIYAKRNSADNEQAVYREYTATNGDITVGIEESGTVSLEQVSVSFPIDATLDKVLVKAGYNVSEGDALAEMNKESVAEKIDEYNTEIENSKSELEQAIADQQIKLASAKSEYESSTYLSTYAPIQQTLTKQEIDNNLENAESNLKKLQDSLIEYTELQKTYPDDYKKLTELKAKKEGLEDTLDEYKEYLEDYQNDNAAEISDANTYSTSLSKAQSTLESAESEADYQYTNYILAESKLNTAKAALAADPTNTTLQAAVTSAQSAYDSAYSEYVKAQQTVSKAEYSLSLSESSYSDYEYVDDRVAYYQDKISYYQKQVTAATKEYSTYLETYNESYKITGDEIDDKIISLNEEIKTAEYNLNKLKLNYDKDIFDADQKLYSNINEANNAKTVYNLTSEQLKSAVNTQQKTYDKLVNDLNDLNDKMTNTDIITAPCSGTVVSVSVTDGSDIQANQTIITIASMQYVYASVAISEEDISSISIGQEAEVELTAFEDQTFAAQVDSISTEPARSSSSSVSYTVTVKLTDENLASIYTGMSGNVTFIQKQVKDVLYVSKQAITTENGVSTVLKKNDDGTQTKTEIKTGFSDGRFVEIKSGLESGDTVLVESAVSSSGTKTNSSTAVQGSTPEGASREVGEVKFESAVSV